MGSSVSRRAKDPHYTEETEGTFISMTRNTNGRTIFIWLTLAICCAPSCTIAFSLTAPNMFASLRRRAQPHQSGLCSSSSDNPLERIDWNQVGEQIMAETKEAATCLGIAVGAVLPAPASVKAQPTEIVALCDALDALDDNNSENNDLPLTRQTWKLRRRAMELQRYNKLAALMRDDYEAYVATASFLSPSRIPRTQLPNVQDVPYYGSINESDFIGNQKSADTDERDVPLVADCTLQDAEFRGNLLDQILLKIFRNLVTKNTGGVTSDTPGLAGLLEQGRTFMLQPNQTAEAQHAMVYNTLGGLMTPVLPPFYRLFMSGILPAKTPGGLGGKQLGPWFYAPTLTAFVTPTFFAFLVGPSTPNRRKDGQRGGLIVEKCQFLQQSGCKGLCLHQCKIPAQEFFANELGLPLTVSPNFETQECQWSFGETPLPAAEDPSFPTGCLVGCESRKAVAGKFVNLCN